MRIRVRPAVVDDIETLQRISERAWYTAHGEVVDREAIEAFLDEYYDVATFKENIEDDDVILYVAETDSQDVIGFTLAHPIGEAESTYVLGRIYIHPEWWNQGVGTQLLRQTESTVHQQGGDRIKLGVIAENESAVRFYERRGYERIEEGYDDRLEVRNYTYAKDLAV